MFRALGRVFRTATRISRPRPVEPLEHRLLFAAGDFDTSFGGGDGWVDLNDGIFANDGVGQPAAGATLADGSIVVAGEYWRATPSGIADVDVALVRYKPDGSLDTAFARGGADGDGV